MRHLTDIDSKPQAEAFVAYLLTKGISTHVEAESPRAGSLEPTWSVWIRDEDRLPEANRELHSFLAEPNHERYRAAINEARTIVQKERDLQKQREKNIQKVKYKRPVGAGGKMPPLTLALILLCIAFGLITEFGYVSDGNKIGAIAMKELKFVDYAKYVETRDPAYSLKQGELWRIITPAFLHGGTLHLLLNMISLASLGRLTEKVEGIGKYAIILLLSAMGAHLLQGLMPTNLWGTPNFVGISGVVLGLFGYLAVKSQLHPDCGFFFPPDAYVLTGMLLLAGFLSQGGLGMANMAHLGGLATGALLGLFWSR